MKNLDAIMRERYEQKEYYGYTRLQKKIDKKIREEKTAFHNRIDKDEEADEAYQKLLNLKAKLEGEQ